MKLINTIIFFAGLMFFAFPSYAADNIPLVPVENTALTKEEVDAYLTGKSLGMARVAEMNHFPSPRRVLKMKEALVLDNPQKNRTILLNKKMRKYAIRAGRQIVQKEKLLNEIFKQDNIDELALKKLVKEIAALKGELRFIHLQAHIAQRNFLTEDQIAVYSGRSKTTPLPTAYAFDE